MGFAPMAGAEWTAAAPGGLVMAVVEDPSGAEGQYRLERRQGPQGLDRSFGQQGSVRFGFGDGTAVPAGLRVDPQGQILVFGFTEPASGHHAALLARLDAQGTPDPRWGPGGLSRVAAPSADLIPADALVGDGGHTWVLGTLTAAAGERVVLFRLGPEGRLDGRLGAGGFLHLPAAIPAQALSLAQDGGAWLIGLLQGSGGSPRLQAWRWHPAATEPPRMLVEQALPDRWAENPSLEQRQGRWGWRASADTPGRPWVPWPGQAAAGPPAAPSAPAPAALAAEGPGGSVFNPYATTAPPGASPRPERQEAPEESTWPWWAASILVVAAGAWWAWRRR